jgi:membrane associated rhomboid family serine protease
MSRNIDDVSCHRRPLGDDDVVRGKFMISSRLGIPALLVMLFLHGGTVHVEATIRRRVLVAVPVQCRSIFSIRGGGYNNYWDNIPTDVNNTGDNINENAVTPSIAPRVGAAAATTVPPALSYANEHEEWLRQQQQQQYREAALLQEWQQPQQQQPSKNDDACSYLDIVRAYCMNMYRTSPTTFWTTASCLSVFLLWQVAPPRLRPLLHGYFLCSRASVRRSKGLSLLLASISHNSFRHLLVNLMTMLHFAPKLLVAGGGTTAGAGGRRMKSRARHMWTGPAIDVVAGAFAGDGPQRQQRQQRPLWPLVVGGALWGNLLFVSFRRRGSCLGLSGVTMAMMAVLGSSDPTRQLKLGVGFIPISLRAKHAILILLLVSLVGSLFDSSSTICHLGHLGGLLYGMTYHQLAYRHRSDVIRRYRVIKKYLSGGRT